MEGQSGTSGCFLPAEAGSSQFIPSCPKTLGGQHTPWRGNRHTAGKHTAPPPPGRPWPPHWPSVCRRTATPWSLQGKGPQEEAHQHSVHMWAHPASSSSQDSIICLAACWGPAWMPTLPSGFRGMEIPNPSQAVTLTGRAGEQSRYMWSCY